MEGQLLGAYRLEAEIGSGGMGTVYRASVEEEVHGLVTGEQVALKVIHPHLLAMSGFFKRFLREAEVGQRVRHENVVATLDVDATLLDDSQVNFLVMEYVDGETLQERLDRSGSFETDLVREMGCQIASGLTAIHEAGIVHRDLKPENILVTSNGQLQIMDLGVARIVEESVELTKEGHFAGSFFYAAPEQFRGERVGLQADLYSFGVILHELITGTNPFRGDNMLAAINAHLQFRPPPIRDQLPETDESLCNLVSDLLRKDPGERPQSAVIVEEALKNGSDSEWWTRRSAPPPEPPRKEFFYVSRGPRAEKKELLDHLPWILLSAVIAAALLVLILGLAS